MLDGILGVRLILLMGNVVPLPAPYEVVSALTDVEVTQNDQTGDGFQLNLTLAKDTTFDYSLLRSGALEPLNRVIIAVLIGALPEVLIDGVITHHQLSPSNEPGMSSLTVTGKDVSQMMDLNERNAKYENQPDFLIATQLIAQYAQYGLVPQVMPTTDIPIFLERIPRQAETDLQFIKRLAQRNGFVFYIEPVTFGVSTAYFGPENRLSIPQAALTVDMGEASNVTSLSFSNDALAPVGAEGRLVEPFTKTTLPIPPLPSLRIPPLSASPAQPRRTKLLRDTANQNLSKAATTIVSEVTNSAEAISGQGEVDTIRYGHALRARKLVGVRGAGLSYNGFYYVKRVTHKLKQGAYTQSFSLSREGTGALLPVVRP